jgi:hypothetical protein
MKDNIAGGIAVLFCAFVIGFVAEYWIYMVWIGVGLAVLFSIACVVGFGIEHLQEFTQKRKDAMPPQPAVLGRVKVDSGVAVVTRNQLCKYNRYPCVLTLSHFGKDGRLAWSHATYLTCGRDEGKVVAGMRGWKPVYVNSGSANETRIITMHQPDGQTVWQVYPPDTAPDLTLNAGAPWRYS